MLRSVRRTGKLLVVHEDNHTAGFGAEVMATVMEKAGIPVLAKRVTRDDIHVPFQFERQIDTLPSYRRIMEAAAALLGFELGWEAVREESGPAAIAAIGSGPADDEVEIVELLVKPGDHIRTGDLVAVVEATKAAVDVQATVTGKVLSIPVELKQKLPVGAPLIYVEADPASVARQVTVTSERIDKAILTRRAAAAGPADRAAHRGCRRRCRPRRRHRRPQDPQRRPEGQLADPQRRRHRQAHRHREPPLGAAGRDRASPSPSTRRESCSTSSSSTSTTSRW